MDPSPPPPRDAWVAGLAVLVALVPFGACVGLVGALGLLYVLTGSARDDTLLGLATLLILLGVAALAGGLSFARRASGASSGPRAGVRLAVFGVLAVGSWLLFLYALLAVR